MLDAAWALPQTKTPRALMCHCRYRITFNGTAVTLKRSIDSEQVRRAALRTPVAQYCRYARWHACAEGHSFSRLVVKPTVRRGFGENVRSQSARDGTIRTPIHRLACDSSDIERAAAQVARLPNVVGPILLVLSVLFVLTGRVSMRTVGRYADRSRRSAGARQGVPGAIEPATIPYPPAPLAKRSQASLCLFSPARELLRLAPAHRTSWQPFPMRAVQSELIDCETRAALSSAHLPSNSQCTQTTHSSHAVCVQLTHPAACAGQFR